MKYRRSKSVKADMKILVFCRPLLDQKRNRPERISLHPLIKKIVVGPLKFLIKLHHYTLSLISIYMLHRKSNHHKIWAACC